MNLTLKICPLLLPAVISLLEPASAAATAHFIITLDSVPEGSSTLEIGDQFTGTISYTAVVPTVGPATLDPSVDSGITLTFDFDGRTYTQADDTAFPSFPRLYFQNGALRGFSFEALNQNPDSLPEGFVMVESSNHFFYSFNGNGEYSGSVTWPSAAPIPEISSISLLPGIALLAAVRRRRPR